MSSGLITTYLGEDLMANRPATPDVGAGAIALFYATDDNEFSIYADGAWIEDVLNSGGFTAASTTEQLTGTETTKGSTPDSVAALWEQGSDVASAGTISIGEGGYFNITGTTTITDIDFATDKAGRKAWVKFAGILTLTHNASTLILPTGANITTAAGDTACFVSEGSDVVRCVSYSRASGAALVGGGSGNLIGVQTITATGAGTYTPTSGTASIVIELQGAGGAGGSIASPGSGNVATARGGGGGGYLRKRLTANFSGASYSVGAKGTAGAAGNNPGNAGGNTTFTDTAGSPTTYTASGGGAGTGGSGVTAPFTGASIAGGAATNGDLNVPGGSSYGGLALSSTQVRGAIGGISHFSRGATYVNVGAANTTSAGTAADGKGGGGGGAGGTGTDSARAGGDGSDGIIIIWEYGT